MKTTFASIAAAGIFFLGSALPVMATTSIYSGFLDVTYDATNDLLAADGYSLQFDDGINGPLGILGGHFALAATIDESRSFLGGSVNITGTLPTLGFTSGTLLTGNLTDLIAPQEECGGTIGFLFNATGGDALRYFADSGCLQLGGFCCPGDLTEDFDNLIRGISATGNGFSFTNGSCSSEPVPEPATMILFGTGLSIMAGATSRIRKKTAQK